jgi:phosphate transport system permease protein
MAEAFLLALLAATALAFAVGRGRALASIGPARRSHSRPHYHGAYVALWSAGPAAAVYVAWLMLEPAILDALLRPLLPAAVADLPLPKFQVWLADLRASALGGAVVREADADFTAALSAYTRYRQLGFALTGGLMAILIAGGLVYARGQVGPDFRARIKVETAVSFGLGAAASVAVLTTIGIVLSLLFEAIRFFAVVPVFDFLFGLAWSPQIAIRADQAGASGAFGAVPLFLGTGLISVIAMLVAAPVGLLSAIYMSEYASPKQRAVFKPLLEVLAGIPTVVYGFFAALVIAPMVAQAGTALGLDVASESALAAGLVMGVMIIPFVSSLSDDVITVVPQSLREGSLALGATRSETIRRVVLPAALPGIVSALLLGVSRAIGETMIVVMAAGLAARLTVNPLEAVTTITVQIAALLVGDQEFDSPKTLAAFALGLALLLSTLALNVFALWIVRRYRERYD